MRNFKFIDTEVHLKIDIPLPKFKEITRYIDHSNLLTPLQTALYTKLLNFPNLITYLHVYNGAQTIHPWKTSPQKIPLRQTPSLEIRLNEELFFFSGFSSNKPG